MKLALAQMRMEQDWQQNLQQALALMEQAKAAGAELILFPELTLTPFFPQYERRDVTEWVFRPEGEAVQSLCQQCRRLSLYACPNLYWEESGKRYDASLIIDHQGNLLGVSKMVHIAQAEHFYEQDYYTPSEEGFRVYDTPFGKVGIVICFDRHLPDGIRSCAQQGAELVLIPTANIVGEPLELFAWEVQVQAFQNTVFVAMCNRVGQEDQVTFCGESLVASPDGTLLQKADDAARLLIWEVPLEQASAERSVRPWLTL